MKKEIVTPKESKSTREQALQWWSNLGIVGQEKMIKKYGIGVTGREIEIIWTGEGHAMEAITPKESDDVESAADEYVKAFRNTPKDRRIAFMAGAQWQKERNYTIEEIKDALKQWTEQCVSSLSPRFTEYLLSSEWKNRKK